MAIRALVAAGLATVSLLAFAPAADAKPKIYLDFGPGFGPGYYDSDCEWIGHSRRCYGPQFRRYHDNDWGDWDDSDYYDRERVSCGEAKESVRDRGFRKVRTRDCDGRLYTFTGRKRGDLFLVKVNAFTGRITSISKIR